MYSYITLSYHQYENIGRGLQDLKLKVIFNNLKSLENNKIKINKLDYIKLKIFCMVKETWAQTKRKLTEWDKTLASNT